VKRVKKLLAQQGDVAVRDLALFSTAIDSMLRSHDLLALIVKDVRKRNGAMRDTFEVTMTSTGQSVRCVLSKTTMRALDAWVRHSDKKQSDYLFTSRLGGPLSHRQLIRLVKKWVAAIGLDPSLYGTESLRRSRATYILNETGNFEAVRIMLGLSDVGSVAKYLIEANRPNVLAINRAHEM
jgi:integrase